jgi:hypothetical protein
VAPGLSLRVFRPIKLLSSAMVPIDLENRSLILHFTDESSQDLREQGALLQICARLKKRCDGAVPDTFFRNDID